MSYLDANSGRIISVDSDVLGIKNQIEEMWPELRVHFDTVDEQWVVVQREYNGVESLLLTTTKLDHNLLDIIHRADMQRKGADPEKEVDDWNKAIERERDRQFEDQLGDMVDRLRHAFRKDGLYNHCSISHMPVGKKVNNRRVISARSI